MSIVYDYRGVASQMKGDDWWTAAPREPPEPEPVLWLIGPTVVEPAAPLIAKPSEIMPGVICTVYRHPDDPGTILGYIPGWAR